MEIFHDYMSKLKFNNEIAETSIFVTFSKQLVLFYDFISGRLHIHSDFYQMLKSAFPFINKNDLVVWFEKIYDVPVEFFAV